MITKMISVFFLLYVTLVVGQNNNLDNNDTIRFIYNKEEYRKVAQDSVFKIYNNQIEFAKVSNGISKHYAYKDLILTSVPAFRLSKNAIEEYDCNKPIEGFILFNDSVRYQNVIIKSKKEYLATITIPNPYVEMEKILNLKPGSISDRSAYNSEVLSSFVKMPILLGEEKVINNTSQNFFFCIYGIKNVYFEIEKQTGLIFANRNYFDDKQQRIERIPINDFIQNYIGEKMVKAVARQYYEDVNWTGELDRKVCAEKKYIKPKIIIFESK